MGRSVDLYSYDLEKLNAKLIDYCDIMTNEDNQKLEDILRTFGNVIGDRYVILNNEFWEDYSCYYNVSTVIDKAFKVEDSFGEVFCNYDENITGRKELVSAMECCESNFWYDDEE